MISDDGDDRDVVEGVVEGDDQGVDGDDRDVVEGVDEGDDWSGCRW